MKPDKLKLRTLRPEDEESFKKAVAAFKNEVSPFEFAFDIFANITNDPKLKVQKRGYWIEIK